MLQIRPAQLEDVRDMSTVFSRSFHPVSAYMRQSFPNTPIVQTWWEQVYTAAINDPDATVMVITDSPRNEEIIALIIWRTYRSQEGNGEASREAKHEAPSSRRNQHSEAGTFGYVPLTPNHNHEYVSAMIDFMIKTHAEQMGDKPHIMIELVLTVHERKGTGAGRVMIEKVCEEADKESLDTFVVTNGAIVAFYKKFAFELKDTVAMPGGLGYEENILIRRARDIST